MEEEFMEWIDMLDEYEQEEALPSWFDACKVIGEIPGSGNSLLLVSEGVETGAIYEFRHDGWEFIKRGNSMEEFLVHTIKPDADRLLDIATHMRFVSDNNGQQWWAKKLRFKSGEVVLNKK